MLDKNFPLKADLHIHSHIRNRLFYAPFLYDSVLTVKSIVKKVKQLDIKIVSITDHDSLEGYMEIKRINKIGNLGLIVVPGCEISSKGGHILAYGINEEIKQGLSPEKTIDEIHKQGGIAIAAHPYMPLALKDKIFELDLDGIELTGVSERIRTKTIEAAIKLNLPGIVGSDAHQPQEIGKSSTFFRDSCKDHYDVIDAIKKHDFLTLTGKTNIIQMPLRHLWYNLLIQGVGKFPK